MSDTAEFTVELEDEVSRNSSRAASAMSDLKRKFRGVGKAAKIADDEIEHFNKEQRRAAMSSEQRKLFNLKERINTRVNDQLLQQHRNVRKINLGWMKTAAVVGAAAAAYVGLRAAAAGANATMERVVETEATVAMFERLTHQGEKTFTKVSALARDFGLDIDKTNKQFGKFLKLQFSETEAQKFVKLGADMQALGNSAEDVQGIFTAIGQIKSKDKLQAEELLQLAERGVSGKLIKDHIARMMGIARDEVESEQRKGNVDADVGLAAIEAALNEKLNQSKAGETGAEFVKNTMRGARNRMQQEAKFFWIDLADEAKPGLKNAFNIISDGIRDLTSDHKNMERLRDLMQGVGTAFERTAELLDHAIPLALDAATAFGGGLKEGYSKLGGKVETADEMMRRMKDTMELATPIAKTLGQALGGVARTAELIAEAAEKIASLGGGIADLLGIGVSREDELALMKEHRDFAAQLRKENAAGLKGSGDEHRAAGRAAALAYDLGFREEAQIKSPSKVGEKRGKQWAQGVNRGAEKDISPGSLIPSQAQARQGASGAGDAHSLIPSQTQARSADSSGGSKFGRVFHVDVGGITVQGTGDPGETARLTVAEFQRLLGQSMDSFADEAGA